MATSLKASVAYSLIQPISSSMKTTITGRGVGRVGKGQEVAILRLLAVPLMIKFL